MSSADLSPADLVSGDLARAADLEGQWVKLLAVVDASVEYDLAEALGAWSERGYEALDERAQPTLPGEARLEQGRIAFGLYVSPAEEPQAHAAFRAALAHLGPPHAQSIVHREPITPGWSQRWREHFDVCQVSPRLVIRPTWRTAGAPPGCQVIDLDPGAAFGTGTHATTRLCLDAIDRHQPAQRVLDLGTGSGVLAVAAALLGSEHVLALDTDPLAVEVARANVWANAVDDRVHVSQGGVEQAEGRFELVVANIMARPLLELAAALTARVAPGGVLALSGVLREEAERVQRAYVDCGLCADELRFEGEWALLALRAADDSPS